MTEPEDIVVGAEFAAYRDGLLDAVRPAGPTAVRTTVRRRRRRTTVVAAAAVALAVAVPVVANAALRPPPAPPAGTPTPEPTPSTSGGPSATARPEPTTPTSTNVAPPAPGGRLTRADLLANIVDVPAWLPETGCPGGRMRLSDRLQEEGDITVAGMDHGDVDGDGDVETAVLLRCLSGTHGPTQVVVFDRDDDGRIVTLGRVFRSADPTPQVLLAVDVRPDGTVRVEVADIARPTAGGWPLEWSQRQWRGYRWDGDRFEQVSGDTTFGENKHAVNLSVTVEPLRWGPPDAAGGRTGTLTLTVHNASSQPASGFYVEVWMQAGIGPDGTGWSVCEDPPPPVSQKGENLPCRVGPLAAGASRTLRLGLRTNSPSSGNGLVDVAVAGTPDHPLSDPWTEDNKVRFSYR
ncbi:hypothetical protein GA0074692_5902 [Micromonospora pallida]|uniref:Uncharacterized protein n=1 Tax=Micromonospora pallida TaxID=145854 RepID=A0A1C6TFS1_9ACTN|nr:hypothetical protein [Micromonospora pallida]SCL40640.1 hypothetical protein GA0074692_5902 [Micromonospora pallida]